MLVIDNIESKKIPHSSINTSYMVYDINADWTTTKAFYKYPHDLKEDLSNYPLSDEMTTLFKIYNMLSVNYNVEDFYLKYLNIDVFNAEDQYGKASPELIWDISNKYFKDNKIDMICKDLHNISIYQLYEIADNNAWQ